MFDMSYDKDGVPMKGQPPIQDPSPEVDSPSSVETAHSQEMAQESQEVLSSPEENIQQETQVQTQTPSAKGLETNMRALREKALKMEKERNEAMLRLQEYELSRQQATQQSQPHEEEYADVSEGDLVEGKQLNKLAKSLKKQIRDQQEQLKMQQQQAIEIATEARLKSQFTDFDAVVNKDNLDALRLTYPEIAATIHTSTGDLYSKSVSAYTMIKKLGINNQDEYVEDKALIQKNAAKPRPVVSVSPQQGDSPLSRANAFANGLTDDLRKQLYKEMMDIRKKS